MATKSNTIAAVCVLLAILATPNANAKIFELKNAPSGEEYVRLESQISGKPVLKIAPRLPEGIPNGTLFEIPDENLSNPVLTPYTYDEKTRIPTRKGFHEGVKIISIPGIDDQALIDRINAGPKLFFSNYALSSYAEETNKTVASLPEEKPIEPAVPDEAPEDQDILHYFNQLNNDISSDLESGSGVICPPATPDSKIMGKVIKASHLNVRFGPNHREYYTAGVVDGNDRVEILGEAPNGWVRIRSESGLTGWVNGYYIEKESPSTATPLITDATLETSPIQLDQSNCIQVELASYKKPVGNQFRKMTTAERKRKFIDYMSPIAVFLQEMTGFPASIIVAQAAWETGWGTSYLFRNDQNPFGYSCFSSKGTTIKYEVNLGDKSVKGKGVCGRSRPRRERGRYVKFDSYLDGFMGYIDNLLNKRGTQWAYKNIRQEVSQAKDRGQVAHWTRIASGLNHYAADSSYVKRIRETVEQNHLDQLDSRAACNRDDVLESL